MSLGITLGSSRKKTNISKKKIIVIATIAILIFLSIWQAPIKQEETTITVTPPTPIQEK